MQLLIPFVYFVSFRQAQSKPLGSGSSHRSRESHKRLQLELGGTGERLPLFVKQAPHWVRRVPPFVQQIPRLVRWASHCVVGAPHLVRGGPLSVKQLPRLVRGLPLLV